jgi:hypothetical protein
MLLFNKLYFKFERTSAFNSIGIQIAPIYKTEPPHYIYLEDIVSYYRCLSLSISLYKYCLDFYVGVKK